MSKSTYCSCGKHPKRVEVEITCDNCNKPVITLDNILPNPNVDYQSIKENALTQLNDCLLDVINTIEGDMPTDKKLQILIISKD